MTVRNYKLCTIQIAQTDNMLRVYVFIFRREVIPRLLRLPRVSYYINIF